MVRLLAEVCLWWHCVTHFHRRELLRMYRPNGHGGEDLIALRLKCHDCHRTYYTQHIDAG